MSVHSTLQVKLELLTERLQCIAACLVHALWSNRIWIVSDKNKVFWEGDSLVLSCLEEEPKACDRFQLQSSYQACTLKISHILKLWLMPPFQFVHRDVLCQSLHVK